VIRGALEHAWQGDAALRFTPPSSTSPRVAETLLDRYGDGDRPLKSPEELEALLARLRAVRFDWRQVSPVDRADVVWVLWRGEEPPAEHLAFLQDFLRWVETPWRRVQARRLASSWAAAFDTNCASTGTVGTWLGTQAPRLRDPWTALAEDHGFFSPQGPDALAQEFLRGEKSATIFWDRLRLPPRAASGGFVLAMMREAALSVEARLTAEPALAARLIDFVEDDGAFRADATVSNVSPNLVAATRARLAAALLLPWRHQAPPPAVKETIIGFLLRHHGDPRVKREGWDAVAPAVVKILRDWLNRDAISAFFRLAARTKDAQKLQWRARETFWLRALDHLDDAWLILGTQSSALLKDMDRGYGRLVGCGAEHCALLLKLRGVTIVESSHAEHERVWLAANEQAPPRYYGPMRSYSAAALSTGADFSSSYAVYDGGVWQRRLCDFLKRHTGVALEALPNERFRPAERS
jgi:hypothetical protein